MAAKNAQIFDIFRKFLFRGVNFLQKKSNFTPKFFYLDKIPTNMCKQNFRGNACKDPRGDPLAGVLQVSKSLVLLGLSW